MHHNTQQNTVQRHHAVEQEQVQHSMQCNKGQENHCYDKAQHTVQSIHKNTTEHTTPEAAKQQSDTTHDRAAQRHDQAAVDDKRKHNEAQHLHRHSEKLTMQHESQQINTPQHRHQHPQMPRTTTS